MSAAISPAASSLGNSTRSPLAAAAMAAVRRGESGVTEGSYYLGPAVSWAELESEAPPQWVVFDVSDLVADWHSGGLANDGVLVKLVDDEEAYDGGGPAFPSSGYSDPAVRPRLEVWYVP